MKYPFTDKRSQGYLRWLGDFQKIIYREPEAEEVQNSGRKHHGHEREGEAIEGSSHV